MSSPSGSDSERSISPIHQGPAPTPGHGLDRSPSNSPEYTTNKAPPSTRSVSRSPSRSPAASHSRSHSPPGSPRSGTQSPGSQSPGSHKSHSPAGSQRSSPTSQHSRSPAASQRSQSPGGGSQHSQSPSARSSRSRSVVSQRSQSRSRSGSVQSGKKSRSSSGQSNRSGDSQRSRSKSVASNRSKSVGSVRSRSGSPPAKSVDGRSRSTSPNLQIDDDGGESPMDKRAGGSVEETTKKKSRVIDSDSDDAGGGGDNNDDNNKGVSAAAIFGDADDISSEDEKKGDSDKEALSSVRRGSDDEGRRSEDDIDPPRVGDGEEEDEDKEPEPEVEPIPETRIDVEIPKISCDLGKDIHFVKLPNFLSVETRPFDPETYEDEIEEEETLDEEGRARLKLKVENTMRWKEMVDKDGNIEKKSNSRLVKWSDGSYSLHLGSEIFDVYKQPLQGDHNHLFIRQGTGLQGQAVFRTKLSFRPHSTESFTHRKMTLSLADRSQKTSGIKILSQVGADPDHDRKTLLKKEEEKLRQTKMHLRVTKPRKKGDTSVRMHSTGSTYREEDGSDEEGISLNAIKSKYKSQAQLGAAKGGAIYSSDEEGSDIESRRARKLDKAKALKDSDTSEDSD